MSKEKIRDIIIIIILIIVIICGFIFIFSEINDNDNKESINELNYDSDIKKELLTLMRVELSTGLHRYDNWEEKIDNNPFIVCSGRDRLVVSIRHEEYGDICFVFYKIEGKYYVKDYGNKIVDWKNYCE